MPVSSRLGFSLIELLVVVAIVAALAALLMPVLGTVRDAARSALCQGKLRQFGLAFCAYIDESEGVFPNWRWQEGIHQYINESGGIGWVAATAGTPFPFAHCPAVPQRQGSSPLYVTYAYASMWWPYYQSFGNIDFGNPAKATAYRVPLSQVKMPSRKCFLSENWLSTTSYWGENMANDQSGRVIHRGSGNYLFADLHVQNVRLAGPFLATVTWNLDPVWRPRDVADTTRVR